MNLFMKRTRSGLVGRCENATVGKSKALLTALSPVSLLGMPECPGAE